MKAKKDLICSNCGSINSVRRSPKGSLLIEIVLWLFLLIPGFIYSAWRQSSYRKVCSMCGSEDLIPLNTPVGQSLFLKYGNTKEKL